MFCFVSIYLYALIWLAIIVILNKGSDLCSTIGNSYLFHLNMGGNLFQPPPGFSPVPVSRSHDGRVSPLHQRSMTPPLGGHSPGQGFMGRLSCLRFFTFCEVTVVKTIWGVFLVRFLLVWMNIYLIISDQVILGKCISVIVFDLNVVIHIKYIVRSIHVAC